MRWLNCRYPRGRALLEEGAHALATLLAGADVGDATRGVVAQAGANVLAGHVLHEALAGLDRLGAVGPQGRHDALDLGIELAGRADLVDEAHAMGLGRIEALGGDEVAPGGLLAHRADHVGTDGARQQAELRLGQAEVHALGRHQHVAHRRQPHAAGIAVALDAADHRQGAAVDGPEHVREARGVGVVLLPGVVGHRAHPVQVGTGAEGLAVSAEHHGAQAGLLSERGEGQRQLGDGFVVECVAHLGAVEEHPGDGAVALDI